jgi:hypothetical protein
MAVPETKVFIGFDLAASGGNLFTLNDTTKGKLDSSFVLGGDVLTDVTEYVVSVSVDRGKSRELDRYTAGHASVTLHNDSRIFDPFNALSPYYSQILPRKPIAIETNGERVFTGFIDDWDLTYDLSGKSFASVSAIDGFLRLSSAELDSFTTTSQLSSDRITAILNRPEVAWPIANRSIATGLTTLQADIVQENTNVLQYLQLVETTENGRFFVDRSGAVTFKNRLTIPPLTTTISFTDDATVNAIKYTNIEVVYGSENLYNRVTITRAGGTPQVADSLASQNLYGVAAYSIDGVLLTTDTEALSLAEYLVGLYDEPELRINSITVNLHDKTPAEVNDLLNIEIADVVKVIFTPNQIGAAIDQFAIVTGIKNNIGIDRHELTFDLGSVSSFPLILDNPIYGRLGGSLPVYDSSTTAYDAALINYDGSEQFGYVLAY